MITKGTTVVIFTQWQAIYYGILKEDFDGRSENIVVLQCRHGYNLDTTEGAWQICSDGPGENAKVSPPIREQQILAVANVCVPTPQAIEKWENSTWL